MACFRCNTTENFIFSPKYCQRKVDLNTSEKCLFSLQYDRTFHLYVQLSYTKISYLRKNTHFWKDAFTFSLEGKFRKYDISVKRKHTKTNENMIFFVLFKNFCKTKIILFMQCELASTIKIRDKDIFKKFCKNS